MRRFSVSQRCLAGQAVDPDEMSRISGGMQLCFTEPKEAYELEVTNKADTVQPQASSWAL